MTTLPRSVSYLQSTPANIDNSATESDSEAEIYQPISLVTTVKTHCHLSRNSAQTWLATQQTQKHEKALVLDEELDIKVPGGINAYLREYQREGVNFMYRQYKEGRGGLLGDDMGLEKGGVITDKHCRRKFVSKMQDKPAWKEKKELPKANARWPTCLIIAPSIVVHNGEREFKTWGYFEVGLYTGGPKEREPVINDFKLGRLDVVALNSIDWSWHLNNYSQLSHPSTSSRHRPPGQPPMILHNLHRISDTFDTFSQITQAYHQFTCPCLRHFGLTGTAIQNSYKELWTILDWTNPGKLGTPRQWAFYVVKPLMVGQSTGVDCGEVVAELFLEEVDPWILVSVLLRAEGWWLRLIRQSSLWSLLQQNTLSDHGFYQLPKKIDEVVFCPLTDRQISAYKNLLNMDAVQNLLKRDEKCPCMYCQMTYIAPTDLFTGPTDRSQLAISRDCLSRWKHPQIYPGIAASGRPFQSICVLPNHVDLLHLQTLEVLREWRKDRTNKVLIFTKSVKLLEMLELHLGTKHYGFLKLGGSTKQAESMPMIDKFNNDPDVYIFLISTLAGGTGLNLTGPAHDLRLWIGRAFRFGQTRDVSVHRLLGAGSVEGLIYACQIYKQQQLAIGHEASVQNRYFEDVQGDMAKQGELFGINNIFKLHEDKLATKMALHKISASIREFADFATKIEKANLAELDWALANMDAGARKGKKSSKAVNELVEADSKVGKDDIVGNMKGLGALLFDDGLDFLGFIVKSLNFFAAPPSTTPREQDVIKKTLSAIGVRHSHQNDDVLLPSKIEAERVQTLLKVRRWKTKGSVKEKRDVSQGTVASQKAASQAVTHTGATVRKIAEFSIIIVNATQCPTEGPYLTGPEDIFTFAGGFARQTAKARRKIIAELDEWAASNPQDSDSSD
ncbi:LOW QUALITY PROTEIN: hypothetical protein CVT26_016201 [Gymnopilus dilepis]|uniref:Helicase C-terminal domain-containing protein n=1 Tax=Gymnopilus dilepis TaxID=231916 RepID=A0A409XZ55_9AGAR|nr:LOW QUALITY PROTEIN: hypothetical protein CVT26_016201 [Gymnopilus dilepis]